MSKSKYSEAAAKSFISDKLPVQDENIFGTDEIKENFNQGEKSEKEKLRQKGYYITDQQFKKIRMLAISKNTDTSSIVREALEEYFKLNKI